MSTYHLLALQEVGQLGILMGGKTDSIPPPMGMKLYNHKVGLNMAMGVRDGIPP